MRPVRHVVAPKRPRPPGVLPLLERAPLQVPLRPVVPRRRLQEALQHLPFTNTVRQVKWHGPRDKDVAIPMKGPSRSKWGRTPRALIRTPALKVVLRPVVVTPRRPRPVAPRLPERGALAPTDAPSRAGVARPRRATARRYKPPPVVLRATPGRPTVAVAPARRVAALRPAPSAGRKRRALPRAVSGRPGGPSAKPPARTATAEAGAGGAVADAGCGQRRRKAVARPDANKETVAPRLVTAVRARPARPKPRVVEPTPRRVEPTPTPGPASRPPRPRARPAVPARRASETALLQRQERPPSGLRPFHVLRRGKPRARLSS